MFRSPPIERTASDSPVAIEGPPICTITGMLLARTLIVTCAFLIGYHYIGYPIVLWLSSKASNILSSNSPKDRDIHRQARTITLVIAAYNEQDVVEEKLQNTADLSYPPELLDVILVTDGSTDDTVAIAERYVAANPGGRVRVTHESARAGKSNAINRAAALAEGEILVFSDANTLYAQDALLKLNERFDDPAIGAVSGRKTVSKVGIGESESLYWKYESALKRWEGLLTSTTGVVGEMFAIRNELYQNIPAHVINDDAYLGMSVVRQGFTLAYEPAAICVENPSASLGDELMRRRRINSGRLQFLFSRSLWPAGGAGYVLCYWSHKFLRLLLGPIMVVLFGATTIVFLFADNPGAFVSLAFAGQVIVYLLAGISRLPLPTGPLRKLTKLCDFVVLTNLNTIPSIVSYLSGRQTVLWDRAERLS